MRRISMIRKVLGVVEPAQQAIQQQAGVALHRDEVAGKSVHSCGGCGAAFLVDDFVAIFPVDLDGTSREFCACCQDFLGDRLPSEGMARVAGYDAEGQVLNIRYPDLTPTERRPYRSREGQVRLEAILEANARRLGVPQPDPLFLAS